MNGMARERISTTVDATRLMAARRLFSLKDSHLIDQALEALIQRELARREVAAIEAHPYENDPDLAWQAPTGPDLPYDGEIPPDVRKLAGRRRK
jgi:gamma-glutamyltranspeptidase